MDQPDENHRILLVEDDPALASMVVDFLTPHGFEVSVEQRGDTAVERIRQEMPDAVVLDIGLPGMDGFSVCRAVRPDYRGAILMLTARGEEVDEVLGLAVGADDYMAKPVRPRALLARLRVHLRKATTADSAESPEPIRVGSLVVDPGRRQVELDGVALDLTSAEFDLLEYLARHAGRKVSRNEIYQHIHGFAYDGVDRSIDLRISRLRKKLGDDPEKPNRIKSVRGFGYLLSLET
jgi:two-component system OmpR family response regulator/two-component system response regulator RstA